MFMQYILANHTCPTKKGVYQYHCWDAEFCVPVEYVFDDWDDCTDGTDEGEYKKRSLVQIYILIKGTTTCIRAN